MFKRTVTNMNKPLVKFFAEYQIGVILDDRNDNIDTVNRKEIDVSETLLTNRKWNGVFIAKTSFRAVYPCHGKF